MRGRKTLLVRTSMCKWEDCPGGKWVRKLMFHAHTHRVSFLTVVKPSQDEEAKK